ncbi:DUF6351 family protein, partial [Roseateles sp. GG27B]
WNAGAFMAEPQFLGLAGTSACNTLYPGWTFPRFVAGSSMAHDVVQCSKKPVTASDYTVSFSAAEMARLKRIFPDGVCDYTRKGIVQPPLLDTWLVYTGGGNYEKSLAR